MADLTVIILTYNEELHIERCIRSLEKATPNIFVVDSFSTDRTTEIASSLGADVVQHAFINQASQFNWALDNLPIQTEWVMRLDADEYLDADLQKELPVLLSRISSDVDGIYIRRKVFFHSQWIRYGGFYPHILLRIWRMRKGRIEQRWMDEHAVLPPESKTITAKGHLVDDNHKGITFWIDKHNKYATREAVDILNLKYSLLPRDTALQEIEDPQAKKKRWLKENIYTRLPIGLRAGLYFFYRYILLLGFLDGSQGFVWHFLQGFWYRLLVDIKIKEIEEKSDGDVEKIKKTLFEEHGLKI